MVLPDSMLEWDPMLLIESIRLNLLRRTLIRSSSSIRVPRLSVTLHNSFTAPRFSIKIRSLLTTRKFSIVSPSGSTMSPVSLTASGRMCCISWAKTPVPFSSEVFMPTSLAKLGLNWYRTIRMLDTFFNCSLVSTSSIFVFARWSDGCMIFPVTLALPNTTSDSSGLSVLMPTLPVWNMVSWVVPFCQTNSTSFSNWPGLEA